ncbi:hypothetical protein N9N67_00650 [Bacteriovoracaceae bacterium]|nr:hypothetical protein [Bacteriovoracaceae bacterium]
MQDDTSLQNEILNSLETIKNKANQGVELSEEDFLILLASSLIEEASTNQ